MSMTEFLIKIASAIADIDGGCGPCICSFLNKIETIEKYDREAVSEVIANSPRMAYSKEYFMEIEEE